MEKKESKKKERGSKLGRTEAVTVRLDEKTRYLAELGARAQRRTLSSFIECAVDEILSQVTLVDKNNNKRPIKELSSSLWDVDEADRFMKLTENYPDLLTYDEQVCIKLIRESNYLKMSVMSDKDRDMILDPTDFPDIDEIDIQKLRTTFDIFRKVAAGQLEKSTLPAL